jgi:DNA gyrase/topoisomerase IV subunit A
LAAIGYHKIALKPLTNQEREEIQNTLREIQEEQQEFEQAMSESEEDYITEHH